MADRVAIIGNAGGGKSTLARALARARGLPYVEVDPIQWGPAWEPVAPEIVAAELRRAQAGNRWLIDGFGPWPVIEERFARADEIVVVDFPVWIHFWWSAERQFAMLSGAARPFGDRGAPRTRDLFETIWRVHETWRPRYLALATAARDHAAVHILESPEELDAFRARYAPAIDCDPETGREPES